ncbi:hypothetical protein ACS4JF_27350 [Bacillus thuringiensis]|uniref:hypothetical protein n=1 Tax=Bacillus thuringiensis TaxID=1428 RepID=UPI001FABA874|nr:hypothetical protein [Bacillus thuringiensis]MDM8365994.1 hypothetical protein [Bacillus thuringiensis]
MTTVSEKVLDVLVIGIYEEYARIYSMITEYEDTAELGPITKEMIIQAHADLQEAILFHQCHITGVTALLMEESFVSLNLRVSEVLGMSSPEPNTIFGEKVPLPKGVTVYRKLIENEFRYIFDHVSLGQLGELICKKGIDGTYCLETRTCNKDTKTSEKNKIFQHIRETLTKELQLDQGPTA